MAIVGNRRDFIGIAAGAALAVTAADALGAPRIQYAVKKLPFDPARIKGLSLSRFTAPE